MNIKSNLPPVSKSGFLLGAALALAAGAAKIVLLDGWEARNAAKEQERESLSPDESALAGRV